jgi:predicted peroxiredoxin
MIANRGLKMAEKLMIILLNTDAKNPAEVGAPFFQAAVAASLEYEVEIIFTGAAGQLAKKGVAEHLLLQEGGGSRTLYDLIQQAHQAGVSFKVCAPATEIWGGDLIPEVEKTVGGVYMISEAMSDRTVTFTY